MAEVPASTVPVTADMTHNVHDRKSFLRLLGEIRNLIYEYCLSDEKQTGISPLGQACRTTRLEYMPMRLHMREVYVRLQDAERFLRSFYSDASPFPSPSHCRIRVCLELLDGADKKSVLDAKRLPKFLLRYPGIDITFDGFVSVWEKTMDLNKLVDAIKSNESAWRVALTNIKSMSLWTRTWSKGLEDYPQWELLLAIDERKTKIWPAGKTLSEREMEDFMAGLDFQKENENVWARMMVWFKRGSRISENHSFPLYLRYMLVFDV